MNNSSHREELHNPYAAPQAPLQELRPAITLPPAKSQNHLLQGIVTGLLLGVIAALLIITRAVVIWGAYSILGVLWLLVGIVLIGTVIGAMVGGIVQLLAMLLGKPSRLDEEPLTQQEIDNAGFTPPNRN
jgi:hypothetical protein